MVGRNAGWQIGTLATQHFPAGCALNLYGADPTLLYLPPGAG
jgi:hypothetical protein